MNKELKNKIHEILAHKRHKNIMQKQKTTKNAHIQIK